MKFRFEPVLQLLTALALTATAGPLCSGQERNTGPVRPRPDLTQRDLQRSLERDLKFREMQKIAARGPAAPLPPTRQLALTQINEDYKRIQIVNNELMQASEAGGELDFRAVARAASEIKKRAGRLKENLILPEGEEERHKSSDVFEPGQLKQALAALDKLVLSFVNNPGFQSVQVIDPHWSVKARSDLEEIIELSGRLKKSCEQWRKVAQKSP